jgi:hypothetical protein
MTNNQANTMTAIQQVYFDICDLLNGLNYRDLGYGTRKEWLLDQQDRLLEVQARLKREGFDND